MAFIKLKSSIRFALGDNFFWNFRIFNDVVFAIFLADNSNLFVSMPLSARFQRGLKLLMMSHTNLNRVKNLIKGIIHTNNLNILEVA